MKRIKGIVAAVLAITLITLCSCSFKPDIVDEQGNKLTPDVSAGNTVPGVTGVQNPSVPVQESNTAVNPSVPPVSQVQPSAQASVPSANNIQPDYSSYTKKQIIDTYAAALNKTRGYMGDLTVHHTEQLVSEFKDAHPGGDLGIKLGNHVLDFLGDGEDQTLNFKNGQAVNKDKETVPILLPQRTNFNLPEAGVANAVINENGGNVHVVITLVPEQVSMGQAPQYNASAVGYLDTSELSFKIAKMEKVEINYPGSVIDATIRPDGYISYVKYIINMKTYAEVSGLGIHGHGTMEGYQTEEWTLNW